MTLFSPFLCRNLHLSLDWSCSSLVGHLPNMPISTEGKHISTENLFNPKWYHNLRTQFSRELTVIISFFLRSSVLSHAKDRMFH